MKWTFLLTNFFSIERYRREACKGLLFKLENIYRAN